MNQQPFLMMNNQLNQNNFQNFFMNQMNMNNIIPNINNNIKFPQNNPMNNNMINNFGMNCQSNNINLFGGINNKINNMNNTPNYNITIKFIYYERDFEKEDGFMVKREWIMHSYPEETIRSLTSRFENLYKKYCEKLIFKDKTIDPKSLDTVSQIGIVNNDEIEFLPGLIGGGGPSLCINIKFIKFSDYSKFNCNTHLTGLLKLCYLSEIASKFKTFEHMKGIKNISELAYYIMKILNDSYTPWYHIDRTSITIKQILEKITGCNIINFSNFVDETISSECISKIKNFLDKKDLMEINDIKMRLGKYNKFIQFFQKKFEKSLRQSIFDFSVISLIILDREDFDIFEQERSKCPYKIDKLVYHGTQTEPISCILTGMFKRSENRCYQHGKGVYFTDSLDYCWYYGGEENNRNNVNKIPRIGETFTAIVSSVYYNEKGFLKVKDYKTRIQPGKNEINFAYAGCQTETVDKPDFKKFVGTEYVIWDLNQICPFMSIKLKREEFCVIWRDTNFSEKAIYGSKWDNIFKQFLKERMKYIKQIAKYNVYPCSTTEEALKLVNIKKYNKVILISNVGPDLGGKKFIEKARNIIQSNVIVLFLSYNISHLDWIKNYKNAIFSNDPIFYEKFLNCFVTENYIGGYVECPKEKVISLVRDLEKHYKVKFNFDKAFLHFPLYKENGKYSDLTF